MGEHSDKMSVDANQHTEDILRRSQRWLQALATNAPVGIYLTDLDGQCLYVNQKWCDMAGMPLEDALGNGWINALHPDDRDRVSAQWHKLSLSNWSWQQEYRFQAPNGKVTWVSGFASDIRDERDFVVGYLGINMDISARKSMETSLRASEERYRTMIDAMSDGIYVVDSDLKITMNNSTIARWTQEMGLSGILVGKAPFKVFPFLPDNAADEYRRVFQTGEVLITEEVSRFTHKEMHTEIRKIPILENKDVSHVATVIRDISERVQAERALKASEERFRLLYERSPLGYQSLDANGYLIEVNPAWLELLGYEREEVIGQWFGDFLAPHMVDAFHERFPKFKQMGETHSEFEMKKKDGDSVLVDLFGNIGYTREGEFRQTHCIFLNITEKKQDEEKLRRQAQEMQALQDTVLEIITPHELAILLPTIVERAAYLLGGSEGGLYLADAEKKEVHCVVSFNTKHDYTGTVLKFGEGAAGTVAQTGEALIIDDYRTWPGRAAVFEKDQPFVSLVSVPLMWEGQVIGVLHVINDVEGKTFTRADQELLSMFAAHAAIAVGKAEALEQAENEIVERKRAEAALRDNQSNLSATIENSADSMWSVDKNYCLIFGNSIFNQQFRMGFGYELAPGESVLPDVLSEEERAEWEGYYDRALAGEKYSFERKRQYIKELQWTEYHLGPIVNDVGNVTGVTVVGFDITERRHAENALERSEKLYRSVLTSISDAVYITDENGDFTFVCENTDVLFGYSQSEVEEMGSIDKLLGGQIVKYEELRAQGEISNIECEVADKSGHRHNLLVNVKLVDIDDGKMLFTCHDITERKQTEDILAARLRISEFAPHHSQDNLLQLTLDEAERLTDSSIGFLHFVDDDQIHLHLQMWSSNTLATMCTIIDEKELHYPVDEAGVWVDCLRQKKPVIHNDYESLKHKKGYPDGHAPVKRELTVPVIVDGKAKAIIGVGNKETEYDDNDVKTVSTLAHMVWDIIERKRAEESLRESQKNLQAVLDANLDSALLIESDGQIVFCNETVANRFGKKKADLFGTNIYDLVNAQVAEHRRGYVEQAIASGEAVRFIDERNGRTIDNSIYPVIDGSGEVTRLALYGKDVTEQEQAEQEIWKTKTLLERTFASLDQAVFVIDTKDRKVLSCNQAVENVFGYSRDKILTHTTEFMYIDHASYEAYYPKVRSELDAEGIYHTEMQMRRKDGTYFHAEVTDTELLDDKGCRTGVVSVIRDVTERKRTEAELAELKNYLHCTLDGLVESVVLLDEQGEILLVNHAWREFAENNGVPVENVCEGANYFTACKTDSGEWLEDAKAFAEGLSIVISGERDAFSFEYPCHSPDEKRWFVAHMKLNVFMGSRFIVIAHENITAQKLAQEKIRESEERYRLLAENSTDVIALYDGEYNPLYISPSNEKFSGYKLEDFTKASIFDFVHPDDKAHFLEQIKLDTQQKKQSSRYEFRYKRKDGNYIWVETISNRSFDENGNLTQVLSNVRDISERVQAEMELRKTANLLQEAQKVARFGHWEWIPQTNEVTWSDEIFHILGYDPESSPADFNLWFDMIHSSDMHIANQFVENTLNGKQELSTEYRIVRPDGEIRHLLVRGKATLDKHNQPVRILGVMQDITERVQAEEKFRTLFKSIPIPTYTWKRVGNDFVLNDYNEIAKTLTGGEIVGIKASEMYQENEQALQDFQRCFQQKSNIEREMYYQFKTSGEEKYLNVKYAYVYPDLVMVHIEDFTERKRAEQEKKELLKAVTEQREALRTLNARVAEGDEIERRRIANELHDQIGQNLSALSINMNIVQNKLPDDAEELKQRIDVSLQLVDETADSIRNVMADLHPTVLDDYGLVPALEWLAERVGGRTGLQVDFKSWNLKDERLEPKVEMNLFRITQEALNNASRHARAKKVMVELKQLKHVLRLSVADDGIGFDVTENYETDEHGWGLRIMRERAESIGGRFRVESDAGKGSKVIVELDS